MKSVTQFDVIVIYFTHFQIVTFYIAGLVHFGID